MYLAKQHKNMEGLKKVIGYVNLLNKPIKAERLALMEQLCGNIPQIALPPVPILNSVNIPSPWWIVGFIVGDGLFTYYKYNTILANGINRVVYNIVFTANQLKVDTFILNSIAIFLGCGVVYSYEHSTKAEVRVSGQKTLLHIILPFFNKYPLFSYKLTQFKLWEEAVLIQIGQPKSSLTKHEDLAKLIQSLTDLNGYARTPK